MCVRVSPLTFDLLKKEGSTTQSTICFRRMLSHALWDCHKSQITMHHCWITSKGIIKIEKKNKKTKLHSYSTLTLKKKLFDMDGYNHNFIEWWKVALYVMQKVELLDENTSWDIQGDCWWTIVIKLLKMIVNFRDYMWKSIW